MTPGLWLYWTVYFWVTALMQTSDYLGSSRYQEIADVIAKSSIEAPLFAGPYGAWRTAALMTAIAFKESSFNPNARGKEGELGLWQIHPVHGHASKCLVDPACEAPIAREMIRISMKECASQPEEEWLSLYAAGDCNAAGGKTASAARVRLAKRLSGNGEGK